ncbi:beta-N-acetylglucosaminidase domain-containing protein [Wenjunlia tyrosinilytica]|uniref:Hyaluronidase n=1 Tax=Wenjunlia tyrosinilytica TaxID=1544741 RepID=A0A917ZDU8_9ACTN|nr:beta-N-acetylglucosaminidase domain-containing protein [Wenjunlia tyrosinilytica]GGO80986.1 hypothetical protein GCM10012280_04190 [Wenjunlia tyrosinilytica]
MHIRRRRSVAAAGATALVAAVISGTPAAVAEPTAAPPRPAASPATSPAAPPAASPAASPGPDVRPQPQSLRRQGASVPVPRTATVFADPDADRYAVETIRSVLRSAGATSVRTAAPDGPVPASGLLVYVDGPGADRVLRSLKASKPADLPAGGYALATGRTGARDAVALSGADAEGTFHAAQTLRQLASHRSFPGVVVADWPSTPVRGTVEGFFGQPWTQARRLAQLDFLGRTKQNRYLYAPGDDPYRQAKWRAPYPRVQAARLRELAHRAARNHVVLAWAVSPGQQLCFWSDKDLDALTAKFESLWRLGVRAFQLQFADVSYDEWHCRADRIAYRTGPAAAAEAQAHVANEIAARLAARHRGAPALSVLPTEYYQDGRTPYRSALAKALAPGIEVAWTGVGVVPSTITGGEIARTREILGHPLVTMDNYPVNDFADDRVFLGPYTGRDPAVASTSAGLMANAMEEPLASRVALFTAADYAWNPGAYRPGPSWKAALREVGDGSDSHPGDGSADALSVLARNSASSALDRRESAYLVPLIDDFWTAYQRPGGDVSALRSAFEDMARAPRRLSGPLARELGPWLDQLGRYGEAGRTAVDMLTAQRRGDGAAAWKSQLALLRVKRELNRSRATVGEGVLGPFLERALSAANRWTGVNGDGRAASSSYDTVRPEVRGGRGAGAAADSDPATAYRPSGPGTLTMRFGTTRPLDKVTVLAGPAADSGTGTGTGTGTDHGTAAGPVPHAGVEAHVPGRGWRRLGGLRADWTELSARGAEADAIRLSWTSEAPAVHEIVPWFADTPAAQLTLQRSRVDVEIGGPSQTLDAELDATRADASKGKVAARAPKGMRVDAHGPVTLRRGGRVTVPVKVTVPKGTDPGDYSVPVRFDAGGRTVEEHVQVRAYPRTGGPDLARGGRAASSGDETPDFPAAAVTDGDPGTRWSSPVENDAWVQVELPKAARIGRVVLRWQDAHASSYEIRTSPDGRTWTTAATVRQGRGGTESVRMDAPGTRFVRVQGKQRATRYGYSLYSVQAYAVSR